MGKMRLPFIDSDLLYRDAYKGRFDCTQMYIWIEYFYFPNQVPKGAFTFNSHEHNEQSFDIKVNM